MTEHSDWDAAFGPITSTDDSVADLQDEPMTDEIQAETQTPRDVEAAERGIVMEWRYSDTDGRQLVARIPVGADGCPCGPPAFKGFVMGRRGPQVMPMPFDIRAADVLEAFEVYDEQAKAAAGAMNKRVVLARPGAGPMKVQGGRIVKA